MIEQLDAFQQHHRVSGFAVAVLRKFADDRGTRLGALLAYYGFFSIFPALLVSTTILGYALEGHAGLRDRIAGSVMAQLPVIGESVTNVTSTPLTGNSVALMTGLVAALWAALGAMQATQQAMNDVWGVPRDARPRFLAARMRSLAMMVTIAVGLVASSVLSHLAIDVVSSVIGSIALFMVTVAISIALYAVGFRLLTARPMSWREVTPGAVVGGLLYAIVQVAGTAYVTHVLNGASKTYGTFAAVIGLLSWIHLLGQIAILAAEVNVVAALGLWPRSIRRSSAARTFLMGEHDD